jgi:hypothetical protein
MHILICNHVIFILLFMLFITALLETKHDFPVPGMDA